MHLLKTTIIGLCISTVSLVIAAEVAPPTDPALSASETALGMKSETLFDIYKAAVENDPVIKAAEATLSNLAQKSSEDFHFRYHSVQLFLSMVANLLVPLPGDSLQSATW